MEAHRWGKSGLNKRKIDVQLDKEIRAAHTPKMEEYMRAMLLVIVGMAVFAVTTAQAAKSLKFHVPVKPPARYDHPHPALRVIELSLDEVDRRCRKLGGRAPMGMSIKGCSLVGDGHKSCWVVIPSRESVPDSTYDAIFRHERGHCNGWAVSHPR